MAELPVIDIPKLEKPPECTVTVPGSKSITNRALLLGALAEGSVRLRNVLFSNDSRHLISCLERLGFQLTVDEAARQVTVHGSGGVIPNRQAQIYVGSAGTAARFLTAMLAFAPGEYQVCASSQMMARPMQPLLDSLTALGARFEFRGTPGCLPFTIRGTGHRGKVVTVEAGMSSQFLSALLLSGGKGQESLEIITQGAVAAKPYVDMSITMMGQFGVTVENRDYQSFFVPAGQRYRRNMDYEIEPDISNANYFFALAVLTGGRMTVRGVKLQSLQGDIRFLEILQRMGAVVTEHPGGLTVEGPANGAFPGIEADLGATPDQTMTLAALAPFATGPTVIRNVELIKYHESDRLQAIQTELNRMGIECEETEDGLKIYPGMPHPATIQTYDDHRMAMAFSLVGLRTDGIRIADPGCTAKTFEGYFELLKQVCK